ncbi:restriction endonuclease subunit S [Faecalimonas umbilicata]|uniref:restriction endonuclease subunit S n=1 Tax=Faecalimonas umbilicata TaxID=1912855 RepID=UPI0032C01242
MTGQQLKNSILQMAVQGKLVPQDPNDEPASILLARIRKEKEELIKAGKIKKEKNPSYIFRGADNLPYEKVGKNEPVCIADEVPFDIPESWEWAKIETISMPIGNKNNQIQSKEVLPTGKIPVVSQGKDLIDGYCNDVSKKIDVLPLVMFGDHTRNVKYIDFEFVIGADGTKFHKILSCNSEYIYYWMLYATETLRNRGYARHYTLLKECFIPLPPLQEQVRIVSKIKAILPLVEKYGCEESKRVSLDSAFPNLLKKSILQEAIQGKLVPQDPGDEPASVLLERIRAEKQELIAEGKIKKDKHESVIFRRDNSHYEKLDGIEHCIDGEIPFDIPESWVWVRFFSVIDIATNLVRPDTYADYMHIAPDNIEKATGVLLECRTVQQDKVVSPNHMFYKGQIIYSKIRPLLRKAVIAPFDGLCSADMYPLNTSVNKEYLLRYILSDTFNLQVATTMSSRVKMPKINQDELSNILIPIPPIQEQERIISRVKELFDKITLI